MGGTCNNQPSAGEAMEGRWRLHCHRLTGDIMTTSRGDENETNKRRRRRGGRAGGFEAEVPLEAMWQPAGARERRTGGGVAGVT